MKIMKPFFIVPLFVLTLLLSSSALAKKLVMIGDSLTEGYGVSREAAYPFLLEKKLKAAGKDWTVVNAGIAGSTSASGPSRVRWQLKRKPDLIFLALGANDGLRGLKIDEMKKNLEESIQIAQKEKIPLVLAGMQMPPNYGKEYTKDFAQVFVDLAKKYHLKFIPFMLAGVAGDAKLNQADGIHPNEKGHEVLAETLFEELKDVL